MYSVVILSKTDANLDRCVDSIRARGETCSVIVVDDGLTKRRDDCIYVSGPPPFNFSRNANLGIERCGGDAILMNDDAELLTAGGFGKLHEAYKTLKRSALVSAAIRRNVGNFEQLPRVPPRLRPASSPIAFVCLLIPRTAYNAVGPLDERFDAYGWEDTDYCVRCKAAGVPVMIFDGCQVDHRDGSTYRTQPDIREQFERGRVIFEGKHGKCRV